METLGANPKPLLYSFKPGEKLQLNVENLTPAVNAGGRINPVGTKFSAVRVIGQLRQNETVRAAPFATALLGMLSFRLSHGIFLRIKYPSSFFSQNQLKVRS